MWKKIGVALNSRIAVGVLVAIITALLQYFLKTAPVEEDRAFLERQVNSAGRRILRIEEDLQKTGRYQPVALVQNGSGDPEHAQVNGVMAKPSRVLHPKPRKPNAIGPTTVPPAEPTNAQAETEIAGDWRDLQVEQAQANLKKLREGLSNKTPL